MIGGYKNIVFLLVQRWLKLVFIVKKTYNGVRKKDSMKNLLLTLNSKYSHSSLAIRYLSQYVRHESYYPHIKEYTINQHVDDIVRDIFKEDYDVIAFSCYIWNYEMTLKIAEDIKTINPEIKIIFGGPEVSYEPGEILKTYDFIDYIIFGEGEASYKALCEHLFLGQSNINEIKGIAYRADQIVTNSERPLLMPLDQIPFPYENLEGLEFKKLYYESSRGCPFNCQYCLSSTTGHVRFLSLDRVKRDLLFFIDRNVEQVKFVDRTFNANPKRALDMMRFIAAHDNGVTNFHFEVVASLLDRETLDFLRTVRVGLFQFEIGVQSTNDETITAIERKVEFSKVAETVVELSSFKNIHLHLDLIAGLPFEDFQTFLSSFEDVYSLRPEKLQLGFLKLLKGSGLRINADTYGYVYSKQAPYEIFYNKYISFKDLIILKNVEEIVELYYNSNRFINCLDMIVKKYYNRAVDFYLEFAGYWVDNDLFEQPHKLLRLYGILLEFMSSKVDDASLVEVMKHDYFLSNQKLPSSVFTFNQDKGFQNKCYEFLRSKEGKSPKQWLKVVKFITYPFDVLKYIESDYKCLDSNEQILMYNYEVESNVFYKSTVEAVTRYIIEE